MSNTTETDSRRIDWKSLSIFITFALLSLVVTIFKSDLTAYSYFILRIFIGLAAAGIAAIIPGFFQIELKWLATAIKASGAIAIFVLIYTQNPPQLVQFETFEELKGNWYYEVNPASEVLGFGSKHYGGTVSFKMENQKLGRNLVMSGKQEWKYLGDSLVHTSGRIGFQSVAGGITADDKIIYRYKTFDATKEVYGFLSFHMVIRDDDNHVVELNGTFHRTTDPFVFGTINIRKNKPYID
jgi:hypothetical protein